MGRICLELVRVGHDVKDTRQRQRRETLLSLSSKTAEQKTIDRVINRLVKGRLLVTGTVSAPEISVEAKTAKTSKTSKKTQVSDKSDESDYVDLAHEALMLGWEQFAKWRQQNRDLRRVVQRVEDEETQWQQKAKAAVESGNQEDIEKIKGYLLQGGLLAEVRDREETLLPLLKPSTEAFYRQSDAQEKEQVAFLERALAESELREQALKVMNLTTARPLEAAATAIQSAGLSEQRLQGRVIAPVQGGLRTTIERVQEFQRFQGHESAVWSVAFSPDGQTIVSGSSDRTIRLWRGGAWDDWLAVCCNRFRHHPLFKHPDQEPFIGACEVCEKYVWSKES